MILKMSSILLSAIQICCLLSITEYRAAEALSTHPTFTSYRRNVNLPRPHQYHPHGSSTTSIFHTYDSKIGPLSICRSMATAMTEPVDDKKSDRASYTSQVLAYTRSNEEGSADQALAILEQMDQLNIPLETYLYNLVLSSFAKSGNLHGAPKAANLLSRMIEKGIANTISYNTCINAYAKSKSTTNQSSGKAAENLLQSIESSNTVRPDVITYTSTIDAIVRSGESRAAERAEVILQRMFELAEKGEKSIQPNAVTLNTVLHAWATSGQPDGPQRAEAILQKMEMLYESGNFHNIQPNTISYTTVIDAYAKSKLHDAALHAERIFKQMEKVYTNGNKQAKPNVQSFNTVINAWALSRQPKGAARAESILKKMIALHLSGDFDIQPNVISFTTVISAWGKSGEPGSANRAGQIFELMQEECNKGNILAKPNLFSYSALVDAWVKSKEPGSVQHAQDIYDRLEEAYRLGKTDVFPSTILATSVIDAWSQSGDYHAGDKAEGLLFKQQRLFNDYKDEGMRPNNQSYAATINAIAKSRQFGKAEKAKIVLNHMINAFKSGDQNAKPTVHAFTAVINACAYTLGENAEKRKALDIATAVFKAMPEYAQPNEITYGTFLKACMNLIPKGTARDSAISTVFRHCCENGHAGGKVIEIIQKSLSREQIEKLIKSELLVDGTIRQPELPLEWSRNVDKATINRKNNKLLSR